MANKYITDEVFKKGISDMMQTVADNTYEFEPYSTEEIASAFELSPEEQRSLSEVINDTVYAKNKVYSSEYTLELLEKAKAECNQYAVEQLANSGNLKRKIISSDSEVIDENILYLILTDSTNNIYTQYVLIDGIATPLGNTQIDLSGYLLIDDFNTTIADYAKKTEVVSQNDVVNDLTTVSSSTVLSSQGTSNELDKKIDKTSIVTTIDSTSTDTQVPSAKTINDKFEEANVYKGKYVGDLNDIPFIKSGVVYKYDIRSGNCTNTPVNTHGILYSTYFDGKDYCLQEFHSLQTNRASIYRRDKTSGAWGRWQKVCTTSVEDVPKTLIESEDTNISLNSNCFYKVINGICYVSLWGFYATTIGQYIINNSMPKPEMTTQGVCTYGKNGEVGACAFVFNDGNTISLYIEANTINEPLYGSFSYPVAES